MGIDQGMTDSATKSDGSDSDEKSSRAGLKITKGAPLPSELLNPNDTPAPEFDCPVCLQSASFPVQLPCRHIFCFLCVKGVANRSKRCALCRQEIPADFFNEPKLLCEKEIKEKSLTSYDDGYQWFYEGRNGWWQYDDRTSTELENRYKKGDKMFELLIAGFLYVIDLENMRQFRRNDQTRRRRIRRDLRTVPGIKGIAGLKFNDEASLRPSGDGGEATTTTSGTSGLGQTSGSTDSFGNAQNQTFNLAQNIDSTSGADDSYLTPPAPNNTPQTPMTPADSQPGSLSGSQEDLTHHFQHLNLNSNNSSRGSPSFDPNEQHFRFNHLGPNVDSYESDDRYLPEEEPDEESQQESVHLNSSNSSMGSDTQYASPQGVCPDNHGENFGEDHAQYGLPSEHGTDDASTNMSDPELQGPNTGNVNVTYETSV